MGEWATVVIKATIILGVILGYFGLIIRVGRLMARRRYVLAVLLVMVATVAAVLTLMAVSLA